MLRYRTQGLLAVGLGILAAGCLSEPEIKTNLRPEGDPEVLAVLVDEEAAFCKYVGGTLDEKGPGLVQGVQVCPTDEADFEAVELAPLGFSLRVMFDELLQADAIETLDCDLDDDGVEDDPLICQGHIDTTLPVELRCADATAVYDGYYYPNGNKESFPVGPAIVVEPDPSSLTAPTGSTCTLTINDVVKDKDGNAVASGAGSDTFDLKLQDLTLIGTDPEDAEAVADRGVITGEADDPVTFGFNAIMDGASIAAGDFELLDSTGTAVATASAAAAANGIEVFSTAPLAAGEYTARLRSGAEFAEANGGMITLTADVDVRFVVE